MADFTFTPQSEKDLTSLLQEGIGSYEVLKSESYISDKGNPTIKLLLKVWDENSTEGLIYDYLILTDKKFCLRKLRHFCYSNGLESSYQDGKLDSSDCPGRFGKLKIGIQKDESGKHPDKNVVNDYIHLEKNSNNDAAPVLNDDVPF